jgi:hypothetical protein
LTIKDVDLQNKLRIKYKPSYARNAIDQFKRVLKMAERWKYTKENLAIHVEKEIVRIDKHVTLSVVQLAGLIEEADPRSKAVIGLTALAGIRRGRSSDYSGRILILNQTLFVSIDSFMGEY